MLEALVRFGILVCSSVMSLVWNAEAGFDQRIESLGAPQAVTGRTRELIRVSLR